MATRLQTHRCKTASTFTREKTPAYRSEVFMKISETRLNLWAPTTWRDYSRRFSHPEAFPARG